MPHKAAAAAIGPGRPDNGDFRGVGDFEVQSASADRPRVHKPLTRQAKHGCANRGSTWRAVRDVLRAGLVEEGRI